MGGGRAKVRARARAAADPAGPCPLHAVERFDEFYLREYPAAVALALALSGSRWVAEDLAQEAFLAAWRQWPRIGAYEQPAAWVRRVVANQATSASRRRLAEARAMVRVAAGRAPDVPEPPAAAGAGRADRPWPTMPAGRRTAPPAAGCCAGSTRPAATPLAPCPSAGGQAASPRRPGRPGSPSEQDLLLRVDP
jgi:Sigma-70 region 2